MGTFCHGNAVPWERFATRGALVCFGDGVGWVTVATAHARPPPARLLTRMRSVPASGLQGMGPTTLHSPASRRGRMSELPNFEPLGFSSRSCRSTGRLMRSLAPWWGEGRSEASSFFPCGDSTRSSNFGLGFRGGARTGATYTRATPSSSASITKPSWTQTCNEYLLSVTKLTHCTIACKTQTRVSARIFTIPDTQAPS